MPRKTEAPKRKEMAAEQHKRFVETAKELEASESPEDFDKAFKKILRPQKPSQ